MIYLGLDAIEVHRFNDWLKYKDPQLKKIFTEQEIAYARACPTKSAERLALRFAAKEAAYKAINHLFTTPIGFLQFARHASVTKTTITGIPSLHINWAALPIDTKHGIYSSTLSASHTASLTICAVIFFK